MSRFFTYVVFLYTVHDIDILNQVFDASVLDGTGLCPVMDSNRLMMMISISDALEINR